MESSSTTGCAAIGNYTTSAGKWRGYAAIWTAGRWKLETTPGASHQSRVTFSWSAARRDDLRRRRRIAVSGEHAVAQRWSGGKWRAMTMPARGAAMLASISCPTTTNCAAVGLHGNGALTEAWNGTSGPEDTRHRQAGLHRWPAVGVLRHAGRVRRRGLPVDPATKPSRRTYRNLAEEWNGAAWRVQTTPNQ